ncbi:MAG TPA: hypothetical protein VGN56_02490 [Candidatus Paceibacterota bacterium]|jgi:hypothetical protein|nr:hypothetical protein [Candidatus Paceibacterota bacterium]
MPPEQNTVSAPAYQLPSKPPSPNKRKTVIGITIAVIVVLLLIGAAAAASFYYPPFIAMRSALTLPQELKGAYFLAEGPNGTIAYKASGLSYAAQTLSGTLVSATDQLNDQVIRTSNGKYQYVISGSASTAMPAPRVGIALLDGSVVSAVPNATSTSYQLPPFLLSIFTVDSTAWHLDAQQKNGANTIDIQGPQGVAPMALDQSHVAYLSPAGVSVWEPAKNKVTQLVPHTFRTVPITALQSPDHRYIAYRDSITKTVTIYQVTATSAQKVADIDAERFASYALGNDGLYALKITGTATEIWKQGFTGTAMARIGFLPAALKINRLLIGSL